MGKPTGCGCGCFSFIIGMVTLFIIVALPSLVPDNDLINQAMGSIFCGDSDAYINESYTTSSSGGGGISWVLNTKCQKPDNGIEDITSKQEFTGFGVFLGCMVVGFVAFFVIPTNVRTSALVSKTGEEEKGKSPDEDSLTKKLRQLEESYEAQLISKQEYDDGRKRLLDNF